MANKKVKDRIEMYAKISKLKEVSMHDFKVLYSPEEKVHFIYLKYQVKEKDVIEQHEDIECYDGKGWLKVNHNFKQSDFNALLSELKPSKYKIKDVIIKK
jgi:hypothetical protein